MPCCPTRRGIFSNWLLCRDNDEEHGLEEVFAVELINDDNDTKKSIPVNEFRAR